MSRPYRPKNGHEGSLFMAHWCDRCVHDTEHNGCEILSRVLGFDITDSRFPTEWIVDDDGLTNPRCTAFRPRWPEEPRPRPKPNRIARNKIIKRKIGSRK